MPRKITTFVPKGQPSSTRIYKGSDAYKEAHAFYNSRPWRELRLMHLQANPLCADCQRRGVTTAAVAVHHVVERLENPDLALHPSNLESTCTSCHNSKRKKTLLG